MARRGGVGGWDWTVFSSCILIKASGSKWPAARPEAYPLGHVEDLDKPRTKLLFNFNWRQAAHNALQQGRSRERNRRRSLWATLRISSRRERRWRVFSATCYRSQVPPALYAYDMIWLFLSGSFSNFSALLYSSMAVSGLPRSA